MIFKKITLEQREQIENIRKKYNHYLLAHSFCTLILWKETMDLSVYLDEDFFVVKYGLAGDNAYFFPCGNDVKKKQFIEIMIKNKNFSLYYLSEEDKHFIDRHFADRITVEYDRGGCEYIFDRNAHNILSGKSYARIRHEINHLTSEYDIKSIPMTSALKEQAICIIEEWETNHKTHTNGIDDFKVAQNTVEYFEEMNFTGNIVYIGDEPYAVAIGGRITEDTFGVQLAKMKENVDGLMFYLLHECFKIIPEQYKYINGDDDMNIEGIRIHKQKMKPCAMNEVWKAYVREAEDET